MGEKREGEPALESAEILLVDDDELIALSIGEQLRALGAHKVHTAHDVAQAERLIRARLPDIAILDVQLKEELVFRLASQLRACGVALIFCTGHSMHQFPREWLAYPTVRKPADLAAFRSAIEACGVRVAPVPAVQAKKLAS